MPTDQAALREKVLSQSEFEAFCSLIRDESGTTFDLLSREFKDLLRHDRRWKAWLEDRKEVSSDPAIRRLLEELQWEDIERDLRALYEREGADFDLEEGLYLLSTFDDPFLRREDLAGPLDRLADELAPALRAAGDAEEVITLFKRFLFEDQGFHGNIHHYYDPDNSYLHRVLERKAGIPISLSCLCLLLSRRVRWRGRPLPLEGIGLPTHFIVQFRFPEKTAFFDPFNGGRILSRKDCAELLNSHDIAFQDAFLLPVRSHTILCRSIINLLQIYANLGDDRRKNQLLRFLQVLNQEYEPEEREDR